MSKYARSQRLPVDEERELRLAIMREELRLALWNQPHIPDEKVHIALALGASTWQSLKAAGEAPPRVMIGGRVGVLTSDLRAWLASRPKTTTTKGQRGGEQPIDHDADDKNARTRPRATFASPVPAGR